MNRIPLATGDRYLTMVSENNNNKFYHMHAPVGGKFTVEYGRIGGTGGFGGRVMSCVYDDWQWDQVYANRIAHGYKDISDQYFALQGEIPEKTEDEEKPEKVTFTTKIMTMLKSFVSRFMESNYTVKAENITSAMVKEADRILGILQNQASAGSVASFNRVLCDLWMTIPRAMYNTRSLIASSADDFDRIVRREANYIDTVRSLVCDTVRIDPAKSRAMKTVSGYCDTHGITISGTTASEDEMLKGMMGGDAHRFVRAYRVSNRPQEERFAEYAGKKGNVRKLFHGTVNENIYSIIGNGLLLNPNARITGKMFGNGSYFAPKAGKSIGYTSLDGSYWANGRSRSAFLLVFDVAMGNVYNTSTYDRKWEERGFLNRYDSVHAHAGSMLRNDEIIVYNEAASCIRYMIEIR